MKLNPEEIARLARMTVDAKPAYVNCEDWLHMVGEYVETVKKGGDLESKRMLVVREHAKDCPECMEELSLLLELTEGPSESDS